MSKKHHKKQSRQGFAYGYGDPQPPAGFGPAQAPFGFGQAHQQAQGYGQQQARYAYGQGQAQGQYGPPSGFAHDMGMPMHEHDHGCEHEGCDDEAGYNQAAYAPHGSGYGGGARQYGQEYGPNNFGPGYDPAYAHGVGSRQYGRGFDPGNFAPGYNAGNDAQGGFNRDFLREMSSLFPSQHTDQFLLGLLIGAGAAWVLSDEEIRGKLIKSVMKVYAGVAGGFEELKEQMADIKAEVAAERHGDE